MPWAAGPPEVLAGDLPTEMDVTCIPNWHWGIKALATLPTIKLDAICRLAKEKLHKERCPVLDISKVSLLPIFALLT